MSKSQNRSTRNMKSQRNVLPPKINNHTIKDLMDGEWDKISISQLKTMTIR
jgi:hypothetical protein